MTVIIKAQSHIELPFVNLKHPSITQIEETNLLEADVIRSEQRVVLNQDTASTKTSPRLLITSPYKETEHQLNLDSVDKPYQLLAQALTSLKAATPLYAVTEYSTCLNWPEVFSSLKSLSTEQGYPWKRTAFYVVEFRSKLKANIDNPLLFKLDKESHREATASGGLLKYWFGSPDSERRNLATCLWRSKEDAILGGKGPWHKQARGIVTQMYESINVKGLKLVVEDDVSDWSFEPFVFR